MPQRVPFRNRAHEVSRLEAFSDVVFGFALTLIVVSLEVPKTYEELIAAMRGFPAFAFCFAILIWIWHAHYTYFRRYGLHDEFTVWMNTFLLFVVLFYVYPLKFVFMSFAGNRGYGVHEARVLFTIYGAGFAGIFFIYTMLYSHAFKKRGELQLNAVEQHDTQTHVMMFAGNVAIGVASILLALTLPDRLVGLAGYIYFVTGLVSWYLGTTRGSQRRDVEASMENDPTTST
jgi:uncharacterized membrane protein